MLCVSNSIKVEPEGGKKWTLPLEPRGRSRFLLLRLMELFRVPGCWNGRTGPYLTNDTPDSTGSQLPWQSSRALPHRDCIYINDDKLMSRGRLWRQSLMCASCSYFRIGFTAPFFVLRANLWQITLGVPQHNLQLVCNLTNYVTRIIRRALTA